MRHAGILIGNRCDGKMAFTGLTTQGWRGVSVNWDGAVNRGYPQFNQNLPNLAKMTNWRRGEVWKFDPFYTFIEQGGAGCDGTKNGNELSDCVNYWPLMARFRRAASSAASFSVDIRPLGLFWGEFSWTDMWNQVQNRLRSKSEYVQVHIRVYPGANDS